MLRKTVDKYQVPVRVEAQSACTVPLRPFPSLWNRPQLGCMDHQTIMSHCSGNLMRINAQGSLIYPMTCDIVL